MRPIVAGWQAWEVQPLTSELVAKIQGEADSALDDQRGGCSLRELENTCFASERCASPGSPRQPTKLANLLNQKHKFVVMTSDKSPQPEGMQWEGTPKFVGCVTAAPIAHGSLDRYGVEDVKGMMLSTLCVAKPFQGMKVSHALIEKVKSLQRGEAQDVVLQVVLGSDSRGDLRQVFEVRVPTLDAVYTKMGFKRVGVTGTHLLYKWRKENPTRLHKHLPPMRSRR